MAKGFVLFVAGREPPKKVHRTIQSAWSEMHRLAALNPGQEVMLLQLAKRIVLQPGEEQPVSVGSHLPPDNRGVVDITDLSRRDELQVVKAAGRKLAETATAKE